MKILLAPDKFKGSLTNREVVKALENGIRRTHPEADMSTVLASDGGDGFLNSVGENISCDEITTEVVDPFGRKINAYYLFDAATGTAYIELAKASGLELLDPNEYDVLETSTYGTGLQIRDAIQKGASRIFVGLGGSATNDGGMGIANALGYTFLDSSGTELEPIGKNLSSVYAVELPKNKDLENISIFAVNDVDNPLTGENGAAYTYAAQKGASPRQIQLLDEGLKRLSQTVKEYLGSDFSGESGAGAAGGTGYGLKTFLNAEFISGIDFVLDMANVDRLLEHHRFDYIITGEGKFDAQTLHGKLIKGVLDLGKRYSVPVVVICGQSDLREDQLAQMGLEAVLEIKDKDKPVQYSMEHAAELIENKIHGFLENRMH